MADLKLWSLTIYTLAFSILKIRATGDHVLNGSLQNFEELVRRLDALEKRGKLTFCSYDNLLDLSELRKTK